MNECSMFAVFAICFAAILIGLFAFIPSHNGKSIPKDATAAQILAYSYAECIEGARGFSYLDAQKEKIKTCTESYNSVYKTQGLPSINNN